VYLYPGDPSKRGPPAIERVIQHFNNVLAIIVLQEPGERFTHNVSDEDPQAFGVDAIAEDFGGRGEVEGNGDEEEDEERYIL
jgi:hypothetical protein